MDRLQCMGAAVAVADSRGFAGAARKLGLSAPAVTRAVAALEQHLGVALFVRTTRTVRLTEAGTRYVDDARRILAELDEADEAAAGINATPRGTLGITAPVLFGRLYVMPGIVDYLSRYPQVAVQALFLDRVVNLIDEGLDVGVRIGELPDSSLHAVRVGQVRRVLCASPAYLQAHGRPTRVAELSEHSLIAATGISSSPEWTFGGTGNKHSVRVQPRLVVNTNDAAITATCAGFGIARLLSYQVVEQVAAGELERVLDDDATALPVHVVYREGRRASAKVRSFVDLVVARLRADASLH
jgi:DNA-binding transcriptional LysR family regulator